MTEAGSGTDRARHKDLKMQMVLNEEINSIEISTTRKRDKNRCRRQEI